MRLKALLLMSVALGLLLATTNAHVAAFDSPISPPATPQSPVATPTPRAEFNIITPTPGQPTAIKLLTFEAHSP